MNYVQNLTLFRKEIGISQNELAKLLNTTQQQISKYEKGTQEMPIRHLITIADTYKTSLDYLIGRNIEKHITYSNDIINLISNWNKLTERNKGKVELFIEQILENQAEIKGAI